IVTVLLVTPAADFSVVLPLLATSPPPLTSSSRVLSAKGNKGKLFPEKFVALHRLDSENATQSASKIVEPYNLRALLLIDGRDSRGRSSNPYPLTQIDSS